MSSNKIDTPSLVPINIDRLLEEQEISESEADVLHDIDTNSDGSVSSHELDLLDGRQDQRIDFDGIDNTPQTLAVTSALQAPSQHQSILTQQKAQDIQIEVFDEQSQARFLLWRYEDVNNAVHSDYDPNSLSQTISLCRYAVEQYNEDSGREDVIQALYEVLFVGDNSFRDVHDSQQRQIVIAALSHMDQQVFQDVCTYLLQNFNLPDQQWQNSRSQLQLRQLVNLAMQQPSIMVGITGHEASIQNVLTNMFLSVDDDLSIAQGGVYFLQCLIAEQGVDNPMVLDIASAICSAGNNPYLQQMISDELKQSLYNVFWDSGTFQQLTPQAQAFFAQQHYDHIVDTGQVLTQRLIHNYMEQTSMLLQSMRQTWLQVRQVLGSSHVTDTEKQLVLSEFCEQVHELGIEQFGELLCGHDAYCIMPPNMVNLETAIRNRDLAYLEFELLQYGTNYDIQPPEFSSDVFRSFYQRVDQVLQQPQRLYAWDNLRNISDHPEKLDPFEFAQISYALEVEFGIDVTNKESSAPFEDAVNAVYQHEQFWQGVRDWTLVAGQIGLAVAAGFLPGGIGATAAIVADIGLLAFDMHRMVTDLNDAQAMHQAGILLDTEIQAHQRQASLGIALSIAGMAGGYALGAGVRKLARVYRSFRAAGQNADQALRLVKEGLEEVGVAPSVADDIAESVGDVSERRIASGMASGQVENAQEFVEGVVRRAGAADEAVDIARLGNVLDETGDNVASRAVVEQAQESARIIGDSATIRTQLEDVLNSHVRSRDFSVSAKKGIGGCHDLTEFALYSDEIMEVSNVQLSHVDGVFDIEYRMPALDMTGQPTGEFRTKVFLKTVYDPDIWTEERLLTAVTEAVEDAQRTGSFQTGRNWVGQSSEGIWFRGFHEDGELISFHFMSEADVSFYH